MVSIKEVLNEVEPLLESRNWSIFLDIRELRLHSDRFTVRVELGRTARHGLAGAKVV